MANDKDKIEQADQNFGRLVSTLRSPQFKEVLKKFDADPGARAEAREDPKGYLRRNGVRVDDDVEIQLREGTWTICASVVFISVCYEF